MADVINKPIPESTSKPEQPRLHKVILLNDNYTPREFVVTVLKAAFRMSEDQALRRLRFFGQSDKLSADRSSEA